MADDILSREEVDALLRGVTGEDEDDDVVQDARASVATISAAGTYRARPYADAGNHQRTFRP
ncbi:hypothetical protein [Paludibacterium denitrificans]|uniref:hypothetical protein n=1 Tax=Paludibacterium denitrificans TaxID=2675226 RepID=UPI001E3C8642|nr:hypothetical protein [Paludibacterium denitrificans]